MCYIIPFITGSSDVNKRGFQALFIFVFHFVSNYNIILQISIAILLYLA